MTDVAASTATTVACGPLGHRVTIERTVLRLHAGQDRLGYDRRGPVLRRPPPRCRFEWPALTEFELDIEAENPLRLFLFGLP